MTTIPRISLDRPQSRIIYDAAGRKHATLNGRVSRGVFTSDVMLYVGGYVVINDSIDRLNTPYGYLRDGEFHSFVRDYQGNVMCVVTGDEVDQTNIYYPDGLPMTISTEPTANPLKYTGKELSLFRGLPVYDFTARHTLPALGNPFRTPDPKAWDYTPFSPYTFCAGDPINYTDPTGMDLEFTEFQNIKDKGSLFTMVEKIINNFLGGTYSFKIDENGKASIKAGDPTIEATQFQQEYANYLTEIINNDKTTSIMLDYNSQGCFIGTAEIRLIDIADINNIGSGEMVNSASSLLHELVEQYHIQINGDNVNDAHFKASKAELDVTGYFVNPDNRPVVKNGKMTIPIYHNKNIEKYKRNSRPPADSLRLAGKVNFFIKNHNIENVQPIKF